MWSLGSFVLVHVLPYGTLCTMGVSRDVDLIKHPVFSDNSHKPLLWLDNYIPAFLIGFLAPRILTLSS